MSAALALIGDWNATPADRGRGTPHWITEQAGLRIHSAGPGRHGDIDYVLSDFLTSKGVRFAPPAGRSKSDHDVVCFRLENPDDALEDLLVATWNVLYGRDPELVAAQVLEVLRRTRCDVLALQEAGSYHHALRSMAQRHGYRMLAYDGHGKQHQVLLVRAELPTHRPKLVQLSPRGWVLADGTGEHAPLYAVSWVIGWLRVVDVHLPPSVNWRRGIPYGPPRRVAAYLMAARKLARWAKLNRAHRP